MREIRRPDWAEPLVELLTDQRKSGTETPVFPTIIDLLVFCAGVGLAAGEGRPVPSSARGLPLRLFESQRNDGYLYLVALAATKDPGVLSGQRDDDVASLFEQYAARGLEEVQRWVNANPTDISGVQALISRVQSQIRVAVPAAADPNPL